MLVIRNMIVNGKMPSMISPTPWKVRGLSWNMKYSNVSSSTGTKTIRPMVRLSWRSWPRMRSMVLPRILAFMPTSPSASSG
jgi:hypothetical protein